MTQPRTQRTTKKNKCYMLFKNRDYFTHFQEQNIIHMDSFFSSFRMAGTVILRMISVNISVRNFGDSPCCRVRLTPFLLRFRSLIQKVASGDNFVVDGTALNQKNFPQDQIQGVRFSYPSGSLSATKRILIILFLLTLFQLTVGLI